jgi:hypothetical protein
LAIRSEASRWDAIVVQRGALGPIRGRALSLGLELSVIVMCMCLVLIACTVYDAGDAGSLEDAMLERTERARRFRR